MSANDSRSDQLLWKAVSTGSAIIGGIVTRKVLEGVWTTLGSGDVEPSRNPADRRIGWSTALQWTVASGVAVGIARLVSQRTAAAGWEAATGSAPPGIAT